jgi:hypothetical protein
LTIHRIDRRLATAAETAFASLLADPTEAERGETGGSKIISDKYLRRQQ